ncbi:hypothetical protein P5W99_37955 [Paraburkholderia sp. A3BS-1L]|uniref:hypothetical protein n=1 Tax=Paraburkholderia sp. A3BS-1L TaxID=3028375 RepID=UPI003DA80763
MNRQVLAALAASALALASIPAWAQSTNSTDTSAASGYGRGYGMGPGMMGGYGTGAWQRETGDGRPHGPGGWSMGPGMMGGFADRPVDSAWEGGVFTHAQVAKYLRESAAQGHVDTSANAITYGGTEITINMVTVQPGHDDQTFEVAGLTNPTLVVPRGATVHLNLVNMDYGGNMEHGLIITPAPPPYPYMSMMYTGAGLAQVEPLLPWRSKKDVGQARYAALSTTFVARDAGTYWYVCPTPRHAEEGMYGKFVVR